jgi:hypothetical protein
MVISREPENLATRPENARPRFLPGKASIKRMRKTAMGYV